MNVTELLEFMREDVRKLHERRGRPASPDRDGRPTYKHVATDRIAIMLSQVGDLSRFAYSDRDVEPTHRGFKTPLEEDSAYGHAILQLLAVAAARGIDIEAGIDNAFQTISKREWTEVKAKEIPQGLVACWPYTDASVEGVLVRSYDEWLQIYDGNKEYIEPFLLLRHPTPDDTQLIMAPAFGAIIAEQGGMTCHAANVARESLKTTIVGTGKINWPTGTHVRIHNDGRIERVSP